MYRQLMRAVRLFLALFSRPLGLLYFSARRPFPSESINRLQDVKNRAARLVLGTSKRERITPAVKNLHWLPISPRIRYKLSLLCHKSFNTLLLSDLSDLLSPYTVSPAIIHSGC